MQTNKAYISWLTIKLVLLLTVCGSCTMALTHDDLAGMVIIQPKLPTNLSPPITYRFYPTQGGGTITSPCKGNGCYEDMIPMGKYNYIATNNNPRNVTYAGMNQYETATAKATPAGQTTRADQTLLYGQPGMLYVLQAGMLEVTLGDTVAQQPPAVLLTRSISLQLLVGEELAQQIEGITGVMRGVMTEMNLATKEARNGNETNMARVGTAFETIPTGQGFEAGITLFGMADPKYGESYTNILTLHIRYHNEVEAVLEVDITNAISRVIEQYQGIIPIELPLKIEIGQTKTGLKANVTDWEETENTEKEISNKVEF